MTTILEWKHVKWLESHYYIYRIADPSPGFKSWAGKSWAGFNPGRQTNLNRGLDIKFQLWPNHKTVATV